MRKSLLTPALSALCLGLVFTAVPANAVETDPTSTETTTDTTTTDTTTTDTTTTEPAETEPTAPQLPDVELPAAAPFKDVSSAHPFYREMTWMSERGISKGWATAEKAKEYRPHTAVTRDVMAAFLYRMAGEPAFTAPEVSPFVDVPTTHVFFKEIAWMAETGISKGWTTADGAKEFRPTAEVDRDVMAAFLYRMAGAPAFTPPAGSPFADTDATTTFYKEMAWMAESKISGGWAVADGKKEYRPNVAVDRDVMAAFLYRLNPLL